MGGIRELAAELRNSWSSLRTLLTGIGDLLAELLLVTAARTDHGDRALDAFNRWRACRERATTDGPDSLQ